MERYIAEYKRKTKAILQNFYIKYINVDNDDIICNILNTTKQKEYNITIKTYGLKYDIYVSCSCPDYNYKKNYCKHIFWLGFNYIGNINPDYWTYYMITLFINNNLNKFDLGVGRNDICSICFENINYNTQATIRCIKACNNAVHTDCWTQYYICTANPNCIYCRNNTMPLWISNNDYYFYADYYD